MLFDKVLTRYSFFNVKGLMPFKYKPSFESLIGETFYNRTKWCETILRRDENNVVKLVNFVGGGSG